MIKIFARKSGGRRGPFWIVQMEGGWVMVGCKDGVNAREVRIRRRIQKRHSKVYAEVGKLFKEKC